MYKICFAMILIIGACQARLIAGPASDFGLFNTGVDELQNSLLDDDIDPHYELIDPSHIVGDAIVATSAGGFPIGPWLDDNSISAWIAPSVDTNGPGDFDLIESYIYQTKFDIGNIDPNTIVINGRWSTDNQGLDIILNGNSLGFVNTAQFGGYSPFVLDADFVPGENTLEFWVNNGANEDNPDGPTGLRVEFEGNGPPPPLPHPHAIRGLYNTGVDDGGSALFGATIQDSHYTIAVNPAGDAEETFTVPEDGFPIPPWFPNDADSRWISPADINGGDNADHDFGTFLYETNFDLTGKDVNNVVISGTWGTDNTGPTILLNGVPVPGINERQFGSKTWFGMSSAVAKDAGAEFLPGENSLVFHVENAGDNINPTGLRVDDIFGRAAPEGSVAIPGLFNTGVDDSGVPLLDDEQDEHYQLTLLPDGANAPSTVPSTPPVPPWVDNTGSSRWIGTNDDPSANSEPGEYEYEIEFDLAGLDPASATILGRWSADDVGGEILLNGEPTGNVQSGGFPNLSEFEISADAGHSFLPGINTLTFLVLNGGDAANPTGLRVDGLVAFAFSVANGDYNGNGFLDAEDIDILSAAVANAMNEPRFDLNGDGDVTPEDRTAWIRDLKNTWVGDANLDGEFNSSDLVFVFQAGLFETNQPAGWAQGDWNGDNVFNSSDFVVAFQDGGFEQGPRGDVASVPEPSGLFFVMMAIASLARRRFNNTLC